MMVADKYWNDEYLTNDDYSLIGGLDRRNTNKLERELLALLEFKLYIDDQAYETYVNKLQRFKNIVKR